MSLRSLLAPPPLLLMACIPVCVRDCVMCFVCELLWFKTGWINDITCCIVPDEKAAQEEECVECQHPDCSERRRASKVRAGRATHSLHSSVEGPGWIITTHTHTDSQSHSLAFAFYVFVWWVKALLLINMDSISHKVSLCVFCYLSLSPFLCSGQQPLHQDEKIGWTFWTENKALMYTQPYLWAYNVTLPQQ